jgi:hypothetical protein
MGSKSRPPDLTSLATRHRGEFPPEYVFDVFRFYTRMLRLPKVYSGSGVRVLLRERAPDRSVPAGEGGKPMWLIKGIFLGTGFFVIGTIAFLLLTIFRPVSTSRATGLSAIVGMTTGNPFFWTALVACLVLGVCLAASWPLRVH